MKNLNNRSYPIEDHVFYPRYLFDFYLKERKNKNDFATLFSKAEIKPIDLITISQLTQTEMKIFITFCFCEFETEKYIISCSYMKYKNMTVKGFDKPDVSRSAYFRAIRKLENLGFIARGDKYRSSLFINPQAFALATINHQKNGDI